MPPPIGIGSFDSVASRNAAAGSFGASFRGRPPRLLPLSSVPGAIGKVISLRGKLLCIIGEIVRAVRQPDDNINPGGERGAGQALRRRLTRTTPIGEDGEALDRASVARREPIRQLSHAVRAGRSPAGKAIYLHPGRR